MLRGKCATVLFSSTTINIDSEILSCKVQVKCFQLTFLRLLIVRSGREEKVHCKVAYCFYLKVLKLVNLINRRGENFKSLTSSLCKRKLQQNQEI